jgi:anti-anti-sigma factor
MHLSSNIESPCDNISSLTENTIILDLSKTKYCDSSGLSAILVANRLCKDTNGTFILVGMQPNVQKMIEIAQLDRVLNHFATLSEALSDFE